MVRRGYFKSNQRVYRGDYRKYRSPRVFSARKEPKKKIIWPKIPLVFWKYVFYAVIVLFLGYVVFFSNKFVIKDVIIEGNKGVSTEHLQSYVSKGTNIFRINIAEIKDKILKENAEIKNVEITRGIPDAVKISVDEYENKLRWQTNGTEYLISSQGNVTKQVGVGEQYNYPLVVDTKNVPVTLGSNIVSPNFVAFVLNCHDKFFEVTNIKPTNFEVQETTFDINLKTEAGFYVKLNTMRSSSKQLDNLKTVLVAKRPEITEYVDLRIDGWAYYK